MNIEKPYQSPRAPSEGTKKLPKIDRSHLWKGPGNKTKSMSVDQRTFVISFVATAMVQFAAWIVMLNSHQIRIYYFLFYYPISATLFPYTAFMRGRYEFLMLELPLIGSSIYSLLTALAACGFRQLHCWISSRFSAKINADVRKGTELHSGK